MDPSPDVVSMFVDVSSIAAWCDMDEVTTVRMFAHVGIRPGLHPRVFGCSTTGIVGHANVLLASG